MATIVKNSWTLDQYKHVNNITGLEIFSSRATGKKYAKAKETGAFVGMLASDLDKAKPISVLEMANDDTGETWLFICNSEPREAEDTL